MKRKFYLDDESADHNANKDEVVENALEDISLAMNLSGVDFVE